MSAMDKILGRSRSSSEGGETGQWMSVSDLMAGLMVVFLFVAITLMRHAMIERDKIKEVAVAYQENQVAIYNELVSEFKSDLAPWDAEVDQKTLSFDFKSPDVLFETGEIHLRPRFQEILRDFFPRYMKVLSSFQDSIDEIRIEGHTSSVWNRKTDPEKAYFLNMWLSQGRTRSVLQYVYSLPEVQDKKQWITKFIAAVGYSSSRPKLTAEGLEDRNASRRVSFRVITNADTQIRKILEE